jgi:Na+/H+-translocating membrane pyrophosphatase
MEPKKVGRTLGIGVRVASNMVRERVERAAATSSAAGNSRAGAPPAPISGRSVPISSRVKTAQRGAKAFGQAILAPFTHAGTVLWLEITGLFFALFAVFFVQSIYRVHTAWRQGPEHTHLLLYCALAFVFAWFSISSFTRAYRKSKRGPKLGNSGRS